MTQLFKGGSGRRLVHELSSRATAVLSLLPLSAKRTDWQLGVESVNSPSAETARSARYAAERQVIDALRTDTTHQVNDRSIASACRRVFDTNARFSQFDWRRAAPY